MNTSNMVSIIVPVKNAERTISQMLDSFNDLNYPKSHLEVIIVDGGSSDRTIKIIRDFENNNSLLKIVLIQLQNSRSPGEARNAALKIARGEHLFFTDADCSPARDWLGEILKHFSRDPDIGCVGGEILTLRVEQDNVVEQYCEKTRFLSPAGRCKLYDSDYMPKIEHKVPTVVDGSQRSPFFATANAAFSRQAVNAIGGEFWDEPTGEDVDFCLRIQAVGYKLYYAKEAVVYHMHRVSLQAYMKQLYGYGYGHPLLLSKHADPLFEVAVAWFGHDYIWQFDSVKPVLINLGDFHFMHIFAVLALLSAFASIYIAIPFALAALFFAGKYFLPAVKISPPSKWLQFCGIRYLSNYSFVKGAIDGWRKFKVFVLEPSW